MPYFEQPSLTIGPLTVHAFGAIVAAAVVAGLRIGRGRFRRLGLDADVGEGIAGIAVVCGILGAHLFSVLFYFPEKVAGNPLVLFKLWEDISSFGGILGGLLGVWLYFRMKAPLLDRSARSVYLDVAAFVFPISLAIGRIACSLAHDHPGTVTSFPLAVSLESDAARAFIAGVYQDAGRLAELPPTPLLAQLGFHDLGWYEFLYLSLVVVPAIVLVDRRRRLSGATAPAGTFLVLFILLYMPVRFALDFLRVSDARYAGFTPAQWAAAAMLLALPAGWLRRQSSRGDAGHARRSVSPNEASASTDASDVGSPSGSATSRDASSREG